MKNVTITVEEEALRWIRREAADKGTSVSKLVGQMVERNMRQTDGYWKALEEFKKIRPVPGVRASERWSREGAHERKR